MSLPENNLADLIRCIDSKDREGTSSRVKDTVTEWTVGETLDAYNMMQALTVYIEERLSRLAVSSDYREFKQYLN